MLSGSRVMWSLADGCGESICRLVKLIKCENNCYWIALNLFERAFISRADKRVCGV